MNDKLADINELLVESYNKIQQIEHRALRSNSRLDLTVAEVHTLIAIDRPTTMSELAKSLGITTGTLTICIKKLEQKAYVKRVRQIDDKRFVNVELTRKGHVVRKSHIEFHEAMVARALGDMKQGEYEVLSGALTRLRDFFDRCLLELYPNGNNN